MSAQEDAIVEAVARAICRANCGPVMRANEPERVECQVENGWDMWVDEAVDAILAYQKATAGARDEVIEECAVKADNITRGICAGDYVMGGPALIGRQISHGIRALKSPPTGEK